jgi:hypothetical protein
MIILLTLTHSTCLGRKILLICLRVVVLDASLRFSVEEGTSVGGPVRPRRSLTTDSGARVSPNGTPTEEENSRDEKARRSCPSEGVKFDTELRRLTIASESVTALYSPSSVDG